MLVLTEKLLGKIPNVYPHACEDGWLYNKNESGTLIKCSNPNCIMRSSFKLRSALDVLNLKMNVGLSRSLEMLIDLQLGSHMDLFRVAFEGTDNPNEIYYRDKLMTLRGAIEDTNARGGFNLCNYIDAWGFEGLGKTRSMKIFSAWDSIESFYDNFASEFEMFEYVGSVLSISPYCKTVTDIVNFLIMNEQPIREVAQYFKFKTKPKMDTTDIVFATPIHLCATGEIIKLRGDSSRYKSVKPRAAIADYLSDKYGIPFTYSDSLSKATSFLINDTGGRGSKYKKVKNNSTYCNCIMITSEVLELVLEVMLGDLSNVYSAQSQTADTEQAEETSVQSFGDPE